MKSYLIVGGSSDIGGILCRNLQDEGAAGTLLARDSSRLAEFSEDEVSEFIGDANDAELVKEAVVSAISAGNGRLELSLIHISEPTRPY